MTDERQRRAYWTEQMELGYRMVEQLLEHPVEECGEPFASIPEAADAAGVEMWFSDTKIAGDLDRVYHLRESNVREIIRIGRDMNARGWILKIEDGFRSLEMQGTLVRKPEVFDAVVQKCIWENDGEIPPVEFVARRAIVMVANIPKIGGHMSGSAIDISVFRRDDGSEVSCGGPYLMVNECTPMRSPFVSETELQNRLEITNVMESHGFMHFPFEFWHYSKGDVADRIMNSNATPAKFGAVNWNPDTNEIIPVTDSKTPLNPLARITEEIEAALSRNNTQ
ncbi:MAG: M15 family metallopeptidase [Verrucomicrobiales bacterium]|nr:M15 family metallopeptidase [Verrucomicrobiales bacterium]